MDSPPDSTSTAYKLPLNIFKIVACPVRQKISAKTGLPSTPNSITIFGKVETLYHIQKFIDHDKDGFLPKIFPKILNVYRAHNEQIIVVANKIDENDLISGDEARNLSIEKKLKILRFFQYLHKQNICIASGSFESWFLNWITNFGLLTHDLFCTEQVIENSTKSDSLPPAPESSAYNSLDLANVPPVKALKSLDVYYVCHFLGLENEFELSNPLNRPRIDQVINFLTDTLVKEKSLNFNKNLQSKSTNSENLLKPNRTPNAINLTKSNMHLPLQSDFLMSTDRNKNKNSTSTSTSSVISNIPQKKLFQIWLKKQNGLGNLLLNLKLSKPTPGVISVARAAKIKKINKNQPNVENSKNFIRATKIYQAAITCEFPIDEVTARFEYSSQENSPLEEKHLSWGSIKMQKQNNEFYNDYSDLLLFSHLCKSYPITKPRLLAELYRRENSIPDIYRAEIWKCLLDIERVDRTENTIDLCDLSEATSRQLDVDIPRCHQYNNTLASTEGQSFIKRVLTKWILSNKEELAYWQGLDSLCAPFCILYIDNEDLGLGCGK